MEPERKIEKLLRAFAKKRRADAGDSFKLHPATRRLLQGEVERRQPKQKEDKLLWQLFGGWSPAWIYVSGFAVIVFMAASLLLPAFGSAKRRAQVVGSMSNLKQIGVAAKIFSEENKGRLPVSLAEMNIALGSTNVLLDPASGKPFIYVAGGRIADGLRSDSVLAYSPADSKTRAILFADGRVEAVTGTRFSELTNRGLLQLASAEDSTRRVFAEAPAAAPVVAANPARARNATDQPALNLDRKESRLAGRETTAASAGDAAKQKLEAAGLEQKKMAEPVAPPADTVTFAAANNSSQNTAPGSALVQKIAPLESAGALAWSGTPASPGQKADGFVAGRDLSGKDLLLDKNTVQNNSAQPAGNASQQFVQTGSTSSLQNLFKNSSASAKVVPVLANFKLQQSGDAISVVDEDGSVYNGYLQSGNATIQNAPANRTVTKSAAPSARLQEKAAPAYPATDQAAQNYFFRVTGTNRSLNQNVVFTGNLVTLSKAGAVPQQAPGGNFGGGSGGGNLMQSAVKNQSQQSLFSNSRIAGTAVINNTNQIEIDALPVTP